MQFAQWLEKTPPVFRNQFVPRHAAPNAVTKKPGYYSADDWASAIDSVWGPGLSYSDHFSLWNDLWTVVDDYFSCFHGLDPGIWDSVWNRYFPEIVDTVTRGRFCALNQHARLQLHETHTQCYDSIVYYTDPEPGVPLMFRGGWGLETHFGAGLTPMPDSSLLVYKSIDPHPLGLVPGDLVLGYDGRPWKEIYPELLAAELPFGVSFAWSGYSWGSWGSSDVSFAHAFLMGAGRNWHLFDSIDVVKYATGDTLRLATASLASITDSLWLTESLPVPGVPEPDVPSMEVTSWGIIDGTSIGMLYSRGWFPEADSALIINQWLNAFDSMQNVHHVTGIIIDVRTNWGAMFDYTPIFGPLFGDTLKVFGVDERVPGGGHLDMRTATGGRDDFVTWIKADSSTTWQQPIAVLTGPGAMSGGDVFGPFIGQHPMTRFFGKPTAGAFNSVLMSHPWSGWYDVISFTSYYLMEAPGDYSTRKEFPNPAEYPWAEYEDVWLTPDGVVQDSDAVVQAAITWILSRDSDQDRVVNENDNCPDTHNPGQEDGDADGHGDACDNCPAVTNPVQDTTITLTGDVNRDASITASDIIYMVNFTFKGGYAPLPCEASGDANCDGSVTAADVIALVNYVFKSGNPPCDVCVAEGLGWTCP
jgi:hypothetical protein